MLHNAQKPELPPLPLAEWEKSKKTLHLILQIIGKLKLQLMPRKNHWWNITEFVGPAGFTTHSIPFGQETFEVRLNVKASRVEIISSWSDDLYIPLKDGFSVASFYKTFCEKLASIGITVDILARAYDLPPDQPFDKIEQFHHWDKEYILRFWKIMLWVDGVFKEFSGRFYGKTCPVHLYWHHLDLTVTRFSGKRAPSMNSAASAAEKDAYSHEVISFGFWAGDDNTPSPAFYSYTFPSPPGLDKEQLEPASAHWIDANGSPMALLMYDDLRLLDNPRATLLDFLESAYQAGARLAGWDIEGETVPPLDAL
jgi:hypothetical protein